MLKDFEGSIAECAELMEIQVKEGDPVMLWGPPGVGKSDAVRQMGARFSCKVIDIRLNIREPVDLRGIPVPNAKTGTTKWYTPDELPNVDRDGEEGILFLDEINTASPAMMAVAFGLDPGPQSWRVRIAQGLGDRGGRQPDL